MSIYLDHAATTPIDPRVKEAMLPYLENLFGNPSSIHQYGRPIRAAIDQARETVAEAIKAEPSEIIFTSGGTEADNLALRGIMIQARDQGKKHLITSQVEHHAVLDTCHYLEKLGFEVTYLPVDSYGRVEVSDVQSAIRPDTALISIMFGNNEIGTMQPIHEIGILARTKGILFHTDAVQAFGVEELDVNQLPVDLMSLSSHKIYGPKGIGALYVNKKVQLMPQMFGGYQERRRRAGTENVIGIVGFAKAVELMMDQRLDIRSYLLHLRESLLHEWNRRNVPFVLHGHPEQFLPHILNVSFAGTDSETLLMNYDMEGIAVASGSACTSGTISVSHVIKALHIDDSLAKSAIRFSFGKENTVEQMAQVAETTSQLIKRLLSS